MGSRENRRVLVFVIVAAILTALAVVWFKRFGREATPEERARAKAEELRERVHGLTHGK